MKIRTLILILGIAVQIATSANSKSEKKIDKILKNVGKRYLTRNPYLPKPSIDKKNYEAWMNEPDEDVAKAKMRIANLTANNILWQASTHHHDWEDHAKTLMGRQDDDMIAEICNSSTKFNKVQFNDYLKHARTTFEAVDKKTPYSIDVLKTAKDVLKWIFQFELKSQWGYPTTETWTITSQFISLNNRARYLIKHITIGGGCTEHGTLNHKYTELSVEKDALEQLQKNTNPDVEQLFALFTPGSLKYREQSEDQIPYVWLQGVDSNAEYLEAFVCRKSEIESPRYTKEQFFSWYKRFSQMWHPKEGDKDYITVQMLSIKPNELIARITMKLQIGVNENATIHDWNMKIVASFNQHDDNRWYITRLEVLCPPHSDYQEESYLAYRDLIGSAIKTYGKDMKQWYNAVDFVRHFQKREVELWSCDEKIKTIADLSKSIFVHREIWNATMLGYLSLEKLPPMEDDVTFVLRMVLQPPSKKEGLFFGTDWTFSIKWNVRDQFYYIYKLQIDCPKWMEKDGVYSYLNEWKEMEATRFG